MSNFLTPVAIWFGRQDATRENSSLVVTVDTWMSRVSRGRLPLLKVVGLPTLTLHAPGRKSGVMRSTPLLCASWGNGLIVIGSNWGGEKSPDWVHNLRAAGEGQVEISVYGARLPVDVRELSGRDREAAWAEAVRVWPNYEIYADRTTRQLPIFHLTPRL